MMTLAVGWLRSRNRQADTSSCMTCMQALPPGEERERCCCNDTAAGSEALASAWQAAQGDAYSELAERFPTAQTAADCRHQHHACPVKWRRLDNAWHQ